MGCVAGRWHHKSRPGSFTSDHFDVGGFYYSTFFEYEFCTMFDNGLGGSWEPGKYCLLRKGGACPDGESITCARWCRPEVMISRVGI